MTEHYVTAIVADGFRYKVYIACRCGWLVSTTSPEHAWDQHLLEEG